MKTDDLLGDSWLEDIESIDIPEPPAPVPARPAVPRSAEHPFIAPSPIPDLDVHFHSREIVMGKTGQPRQAGADQYDGEIIRKWRQHAEASLFFFAKAILGYGFLSPKLHRPICSWLTRVPPYRKMLMIPRGHGKTTIAGQSLPIHLWIQPRESNPYFPGQPGTDARILMAGETEQRATDHLRVVQHHMTSNPLIKALWPHIVWDNPRRQAKKWNDTEMIIRRDHEWPDPSMRAIGVGGAATGSHPNVMIKDDITTERAANEPTTMETAIQWHINSRALLSNPLTDLEFITCTRWAVNDLPGYLMASDPTVEVNVDWRSIISDGNQPLWPENLAFGTEGAIARLMAEFGTRFPLLYQNSVVASGLTDFNVADLRSYEIVGENVIFTEDDRDIALAKEMSSPLPRLETDLRGRRLNDTVTQEMLRGKILRRDRSM